MNCKICNKSLVGTQCKKCCQSEKCRKKYYNMMSRDRARRKADSKGEKIQKFCQYCGNKIYHPCITTCRNSECQRKRKRQTEDRSKARGKLTTAKEIERFKEEFDYPEFKINARPHKQETKEAYHITSKDLLPIE